MSETLPDMRLQRLEYGAVPLDPLHAIEHADGRPYIGASTERIQDRMQVAMIGAVESGLVKEDIAAPLYSLMEAALFSSQISRIDHNPAAEIEAISGMKEDLRVKRAKAGLATPHELFSILADFPQLGSIELAKLSHPFDFAATEAMDKEIIEVLLDKGGRLLQDVPRYKRKGIDTSIPAGIVLRKKAILHHETDAGVIEIVQRRGFVVWSDMDIYPDADLPRQIKNQERFWELAEKIEHRLSLPDGAPAPRFMAPLATSTFAHFISADEVAREYDQ